MSLVKRLLIGMLLIMTGVMYPVHAQTAKPTHPFSLPFTTPPGPDTWLLGQQYGNTVGAYNFGKYWYALGQGLHFGIDFTAPCRTPLAAMADGIIDQIDNLKHGAGPHNLLIRHPDLGYISLYGHLYIRPAVKVGQAVKRGEIVAESGDPDETCVSRPHLHLEVRSLDYLTAYNPVTLIDADWPMLSTIGYYGYSGFAKDLYAPNRWQAIDDQPNVEFGTNLLNHFRAVWPPTARVAPSVATLEGVNAPAIPDRGLLTFRELTRPNCCSQPWWSPDGTIINYWDGPEGQFANVMTIGVADGSQPQAIPDAPSRLVSPDGHSEVMWDQKRVAIVRLTDSNIYPIGTNEAWPQFSPGSTRLLWRVEPKDDVPGLDPPTITIFIANIDGSGRKAIRSQEGGDANWLDDDRVLFVTREGRTTISALSIYTISTGEIVPLVTEQNMYGLSIAPGGRSIMYYLAFQQDSSQNGIHLLETQPDATPKPVPFFGSWRWRDSHSVIYIPFEPGHPMRFMLYDIGTGSLRSLTDPASRSFTILNDDWSIAPDGMHIVLWGSANRSLWLVTLPKG